MYRRSYFCVCDGQQEEMYLKHIAFLLKKPTERVVTFNTIQGSIERLKKNYTEYDNAALFDYDFNDAEFKKKITTCEQLQKENQKHRGKNVYHAYSNVNFDLWLILHKVDFNRPVTSNDAYLTVVRKIYGLGNEADIKEKAIIERILMQITLDDIRNAIRRAEQIRAKKLKSDCFMLGSIECYRNPDFSLHEFLKIVLLDCGELPTR